MKKTNEKDGYCRVLKYECPMIGKPPWEEERCPFWKEVYADFKSWFRDKIIWGLPGRHNGEVRKGCKHRVYK